MFSTEIKYNVVTLEDTRSVAVTSFLSHKSVSHLDLQINRRAFRRPFRDCRLSSLEKGFFCTEESLRNCLVPERRILYSLNLDVPEAMEYSNLRSGSVPDHLPRCFDGLIVAIRGRDNFFKNELVDLIKIAAERTGCGLELLKWMSGFRPLESAVIPASVQNSCAIILHRERADSDFTVKFLESFFNLGDLSRTAEAKAFEYLLYQARRCDFDLIGKGSCDLSLSDCCIFNRSLRFLHLFLKYEGTAYYTESAYERYKKLIFHFGSPWFTWEGMEKFENINETAIKPRLFRIVQIISIFMRHEDYPRVACIYYVRQSDTTEALRLVWSSIPDSFIPLQEMADPFGDLLPSEFISRAHRFYQKAIGQTVTRSEPRPLTHYCRSVIRKCLYDSKQWLPDGIEQLNLPPRHQAFLNLQVDHLRPNNFYAH